MKNISLLILPTVIVFLMTSCLDDIKPNIEYTSDLTFTAAPNCFTHSNVDSKAQTAFDEDKIYNAFFLLFDGDNVLREMGVAVVDETNNSVSYSVDKDFLDVIQSGTGCFVANVPFAILSNLQTGVSTWSTLQQVVVPITYASISTTGFVGVPLVDIDGDYIAETPCIPMFGYKAISTSVTSIEMDRLFAKVQMNIESGEKIKSLDLTSCTVNNVPKNVALVQPSGPTIWSDITYFTSNGDEYLIDVEEKNTIDLTGGTNSFWFYVPEHILGDIGTVESQSKKPTLVEGTNKRAIYATLDGIISDVGGYSYYASYNIFLGENATDNFDLKRNNRYINNITIQAVNIADNRVTVSQIGGPSEGEGEFTYLNLALEEAANCYIVEGNGNYMLPAYKGAYTNLNEAQMCAKGYPYLIACDNPNIDFEFINIDQASNIIMFNVTGLDVNLDFSNWAENSWMRTYGNAVIGLTSEPHGKGNLLWSWHIWFSPTIKILGNDFLGIATQEYPSQDPMGNAYTMMDRNLGAYNKESISLENIAKALVAGSNSGLYYKYGHFAPYFTDTKNNQGTGYHGYKAITNPTWNSNGSKSITDPCPPGYSVPKSDVWYSGSSGVDPIGTHNLLFQAFEYWTGVYYPYSGYIDPDNKFHEAYTEAYEFIDPNFTFQGAGIETGTFTATIKLGFLSIPITLPKLAEDTFYDIVLEIDLSYAHGHLWNTIGSISYMHSSLDLSNFTLEDFRNAIRIVSFKQRRRALDSYDIEVTTKKPYYIATENWTEYEVSKPTMSDADKASLLYALYQKGDVLNNIMYSINESIDMHYGYQVRCVRE